MNNDYIPPPPPTRQLNSNSQPTTSNLKLPPKAITSMNRLGRGLTKASNYLTPKLESGLGNVVNKVNQFREREWEEGGNLGTSRNISTTIASSSISNNNNNAFESDLLTQSTSSRGWGLPAIPGLGYFSSESKEKRNEIYTQSFQEHIVSFGGHACLRPSSTVEEPALVIEIISSGSAFRERPIEKASRSQRVFYSLAKSFAALPRLPSQTGTNPLNSPVNQSVESFSTSLEEAEGSVGNALERLMEVGGGEGAMEEDGEFEETLVDVKNDSLPPPTPPISATSPSPSTFKTPAPSVRNARKSSGNSTTDEWPKPISYTEEDLPRLHENLNSRLLPFFGQKLPGRKVRISIYPVVPSNIPPWNKPLATKIITTAAGGSFKTNISITSKEIKKLLEAGAVEGGISGLERMELKVVTELLEIEKPGENLLNSSSLGYENLKVNSQDSRSLLVGKDGGVRLISDIDDTIKWTEVLGGTRKIFRNVFVREVDEIIVPGMAKWYSDLAKAGGEIHYASNGPQELFPVVTEFLDSGGFPLGSITLKEYGGATSTLSKLFEEPGSRKRAAVEDILIEFPYCRFILVGDSGEMDLDLYLALAHQYPKQVLAIYIRDVTTPFFPYGVPSSVDLSKSSSASASTTSSLPSSAPPFISNLSLEDKNSDPLSPNNPLQPEPLNHTEEMQYAIDTWLDKVRMAEQNLPKGVIFRVFRHGEECREESLKFMRG